MSSIKQFSHDLKEYLASDLMKQDYEIASHGDTTIWMDIGLRVGLCFGCAVMSMNKLELFGVMFTLENGKIKPEEEITYSGVLQNWKNVIEQIQTIMGTEEYKKLVEKGRGRIKFDRFVKDGCATEYIDLDYNKSLIDHLLKSCVYSCDTLEDKIKAINNIDDELYKVGDVFCNVALPSVIYGRYFTLHKDPGTGKYCFKFDYSLDFSIADINPGLSVLFNSRNKLYVESAQELETIMRLVQ